MKKILAFLAGIVFLIAILIAGSCQNGKKPNGTTSAEDNKPLVRDPKVFISLKAIKIDENVHLEMVDTRKPKCEVIDNLVTEVMPGDTVIWRKGPSSNIRRIDGIYISEEQGFVSKFFMVDDSLIALKILSTARSDTMIKYDIKFTLLHDGGTHTIDPYLKIK